MFKIPATGAKNIKTKTALKPGFVGFDSSFDGTGKARGHSTSLHFPFLSLALALPLVARQAAYFFAPPPVGGMVPPTSRKTQDKELPLGAHPP